MTTAWPFAFKSAANPRSRSLNPITVGKITIVAAAPSTG